APRWRASALASAIVAACALAAPSFVGDPSHPVAERMRDALSALRQPESRNAEPIARTDTTSSSDPAPASAAPAAAPNDPANAPAVASSSEPATPSDTPATVSPAVEAQPQPSAASAEPATLADSHPPKSSRPTSAPLRNARSHAAASSFA